MNATAQKFEPESELLSIAEIAKRLQLHRQTVKSRLDDLGYEPEQVNPDGPDAKLYRFDDEVHFAIKAAKSDLDAAKLRDARATYQLKELKLAEARRLMVPAHEVTVLSEARCCDVPRAYGPTAEADSRETRQSEERYGGEEDHEGRYRPYL